MGEVRKGKKGRTGTAPKLLEGEADGEAASGRLKAGEPWDPEDVGEIIAAKFKQEYHETEGPARIGPWRIWRCWTHDGRYFHAHYGVAPPDGRLLFFRDFLPFADWFRGAYDGEVEAARAQGLADADAVAARAATALAAERSAAEQSGAEQHERRMEWVRVAIAALIVLVLLALVFLQVGVRDREGFNVSHVISLLAGAGVAYLLGGWVRKRRGAAGRVPPGNAGAP